MFICATETTLWNQSCTLNPFSNRNANRPRVKRNNCVQINSRRAERLSTFSTISLVYNSIEAKNREYYQTPYKFASIFFPVSRVNILENCNHNFLEAIQAIRRQCYGYYNRLERRLSQWPKTPYCHEHQCHFSRQINFLTHRATAIQIHGYSGTFPSSPLLPREFSETPEKPSRQIHGPKTHN